MQPITISPSALVVDAQDGVRLSHFETSSNYTVHFLFHFSISSLNSAKVQLLSVISLHLDIKDKISRLTQALLSSTSSN